MPPTANPTFVASAHTQGCEFRFVCWREVDLPIEKEGDFKLPGCTRQWHVPYAASETTSLFFFKLQPFLIKSYGLHGLQWSCQALLSRNLYLTKEHIEPSVFICPQKPSIWTSCFKWWFVGPSTFFGGGQKKEEIRGQNQHLDGCIVSNLGEVMAPFVRSQSAVFFLRSG